MKTIYINTYDIKTAKEILIRYITKKNMQYVEIKDEILINTDILVKFKNDIKDSSDLLLEDVRHDKIYKINKNIENEVKAFYKINKNIENKVKTFYKRDKKRQKLESCYVKIKMNKNKYLR